MSPAHCWASTNPWRLDCRDVSSVTEAESEEDSRRHGQSPQRHRASGRPGQDDPWMVHSKRSATRGPSRRSKRFGHVCLCLDELVTAHMNELREQWRAYGQAAGRRHRHGPGDPQQAPQRRDAVPQAARRLRFAGASRASSASTAAKKDEVQVDDAARMTHLCRRGPGATQGHPRPLRPHQGPWLSSRRRPSTSWCGRSPSRT